MMPSRCLETMEPYVTVIYASTHCPADQMLYRQAVPPLAEATTASPLGWQGETDSFLPRTYSSSLHSLHLSRAHSNPSLHSLFVIPALAHIHVCIACYSVACMIAVLHAYMNITFKIKGNQVTTCYCMSLENAICKARRNYIRWFSQTLIL
jgi:hypothetical protein